MPETFPSQEEQVEFRAPTDDETDSEQTNDQPDIFVEGQTPVFQPEPEAW